MSRVNSGSLRQGWTGEALKVFNMEVCDSKKCHRITFFSVKLRSVQTKVRLSRSLTEGR